MNVASEDPSHVPLTPMGIHMLTWLSVLQELLFHLPSSGSPRDEIRSRSSYTPVLNDISRSTKV